MDGARWTAAPSPSVSSSNNEVTATARTPRSHGGTVQLLRHERRSPGEELRAQDKRIAATSENDGDGALLWGERIEHVEEGLVYQSSSQRVAGQLTVTNYRIRFDERLQGETRLRRRVLDMPIGRVERVEKTGHSQVRAPGEPPYGLLLQCRDMRSLRFFCPRVRHGRKALYAAICSAAFPLSNERTIFAELHFAPDATVDAGWTLYSARKELQRMGVDAPTSSWVTSDINEKYALADTYPSTIALPRSVVEDMGPDFVRKAAAFRSRHRLPVLSWISSAPDSDAAIARSSQPLVGLAQRKSQHDQKMLRALVDANAHCHQLLIVDARPPVNAKVNMARGGGYEDGYADARLLFLNIHNIHAVRESLRKLSDALWPRVEDANFLRALNDSKWLHHVQSILDGARQVVVEIAVHRGSVLVHCSDGWDRTAQLTSLAMLMLDPYYRTLDGFCLLIEKEWCSFGHKFAQRVGFGEDAASDQERSPVFLQFIDCCWQLLQQFESHFEFTERLLVAILDELYACRFGTFLANCERQRAERRLPERTHSLWTWVLVQRDRWLNPHYVGRKTAAAQSSSSGGGGGSGTTGPLMVNASLRRLQLWTAYYARHNPLHVPALQTRLEERARARLLELARSVEVAATTTGNDEAEQHKKSKKLGT